MSDVETLLQRALRPVEPPAALSARLEVTLQNLTDMAAEELEGWELGTMRDPRNWVRPFAAAAVGTAAGAALVILRVRAQQRHRKAKDPRELAERVVREVRRTLDR